MQAIWKQVLQVTDTQVIPLPMGAQILCVQVQNNNPCIWFFVPDTKCRAGHEARKFTMYGTGHEHEKIDGTYIGTFQLLSGGLIFHLFETT